MKILQFISEWLRRTFEGYSQNGNQREVNKKTWSPAQIRHRQVFGEAAKFARSQIAKPHWRRFYEHRSKPGVKPFNTAVSMYLKYFRRLE